MEKVIYITEEIAKNITPHTLVTVEKNTADVSHVPGESITWLTDMQVAELEETLGYTFTNKTLLTQAFTHSSCRPSQNPTDEMDNETLEFIGDRAIDLLITKKLISHYGKPFYSIEEARNNINGFNPLSVKMGEGELTYLKTRLVNTDAFSKQSTLLGFPNHLITGSSDTDGSLKTQKAVKEDLFEAVLGAVTVDCDWNMTVLESVLDRIYAVTSLMDGTVTNTNHVGMLQEYLQKNYGILPLHEYDELIDYGEGENFMCALKLPRHVFPNTLPEEANEDGDSVAILGSGATKQEARMWASKTAYEMLVSAESSNHMIIKAVGEPTPERAINQLQELGQKKMIKMPEYTFSPTEAFGEAHWECTCLIPDKGAYTVVAQNKTSAKKHAAYFALCALLGKAPESHPATESNALPREDDIKALKLKLNEIEQAITNIKEEITIFMCFDYPTEDKTRLNELYTKLEYLREEEERLRCKLKELQATKDCPESTAKCAHATAPLLDFTNNRIRDAILSVGTPDTNRAVNQLQELWQKGIIGQPTYEYAETVTDVSLWKVTCRLPDGAESSAEATGKQAAKKQAAYKLYSLLIGR